MQIKAAKMSSRVNQEVAIHSRLKHPSILQLLTFFEDESYVYLVLELCRNGELQSYLKTHTRILSEPEGLLFYTDMKKIFSLVLHNKCQLLIYSLHHPEADSGRVTLPPFTSDYPSRHYSCEYIAH